MEAKNGGKMEEWREALKENGKAAYCLLFLFPSHSLARDVCVFLSCPVSSQPVSLSLTPYLPISSPPKVSVFLQSLAAI